MSGKLPQQVSVAKHAQECEEIGRMLAFRDWLRANNEDKKLYERTKQELAVRRWK